MLREKKITHKATLHIHSSISYGTLKLVQPPPLPHLPHIEKCKKKKSFSSFLRNTFLSELYELHVLSVCIPGPQGSYSWRKLVRWTLLRQPGDCPHISVLIILSSYYCPHSFVLILLSSYYCHHITVLILLS